MNSNTLYNLDRLSAYGVEVLDTMTVEVLRPATVWHTGSTVLTGPQINRSFSSILITQSWSVSCGRSIKSKVGGLTCGPGGVGMIESRILPRTARDRVRIPIQRCKREPCRNSVRRSLPLMQVYGSRKKRMHLKILISTSSTQ